MNSSTVLVFVLLAASFYAAFALAPDSLSSDDATAATITIKDTPTATEPPTTSSSTTAEPVTSSVTTTALPTTVNSTTSTPSPNTTAAMTTTASSTTAAPSLADYSLKDNGTVCIRMRGDITFQVPYTRNKTKVVATLVLPRGGGMVTGYCFGTNSSAEIRISWDTSNCEFALGFKLNPDGSWKTVSMNYAFNTTNDSFKSPDKIDVISGGLLKSSDADMYHADKKKSYSCEREDTVLLTNDVRVKFSRFQMQPIPFNGADFNKADVCGASGDSMTNSIVPIAVGCALAGLIVIVLVAYLIGRRRANRGYQQV